MGEQGCNRTMLLQVLSFFVMLDVFAVKWTFHFANLKVSSDWPHRSKADLTRQETGSIREIEIKYSSYASQSQTSNPSPLPPSLSKINIITITASVFSKWCSLDGFHNQGVTAQELQRNLPLQCRDELKVIEKEKNGNLLNVPCFIKLWAQFAQGGLWIHLQRPGNHRISRIHLQVSQSWSSFFTTTFCLDAPAREWWRTSWCAWRRPSPRLTRRPGENLLPKIMWSSARSVPWFVEVNVLMLYLRTLRSCQKNDLYTLLADQLAKVWFNSLCCDLEGLPPAKAQSLLLKRIEGLEQVRMNIDLRKCNDYVGNKRLPQNWESAQLQTIICILRVKGKVFLPRCRGQRLQTLTNKTRYIRIHHCYTIFFCSWGNSLVGQL